MKAFDSKRSCLLKTSLAWILFAHALAYALSSSPARAEDARVLPVGRGRFGVTYAQTGSISTTFNEHGQSEAITAPVGEPAPPSSAAATTSTRKSSPALAETVRLLVT